MNQKDLIKYGLLLAGAYLIWKYLQDHGGLSTLLGTTPAIQPPGTHPTNPGAGTGPTPPAQPATPPTLDMTGLTVTPDVNQSLSGTVKINGIPVRFSIITADGRIFDSQGHDVTASLETSGVDVVALRTAFANAAPQFQQTGGNDPIAVSGLGRVTPPWLM